MNRGRRRGVRLALLLDGPVSLPTLGRLESPPALEPPELRAPPVVAALEAWEHGRELAVVEIDPAVADTAAMSEAYDLGMDTGANCVVVGGSRAGDERVAACLVRADTRADVNNVVRRALDVRKCSFLPMDKAVEESGMEYGGITPIGVPRSWRLLGDSPGVGIQGALIGSRGRRPKLPLPRP